ncbi:PREDICTED: cytochrome P450 4C1-like isoform X2 [Wasmannia auropunctata]|nr:PREDICTED: cytochrome P450 4C1-like isoform X2 [Wasmannia auropunctata]XP_011701779.1 PREDICTED: cytochrome P450 4C1-like isoform X2 [Wasmannia auropunctata]XP_011701780.1 PREDICTED: cytochrome P450 4C1-like isoform X2 [Wasmannia auropunctata]XP_011701782.1 PREDICTED: cytochrome P450 4C1-like isoform X2 [Wasmannia auropunctata]XP_011701783.1 PREDICTED: cytochrome P450 4C1-like isoform X2 [Wasmannia auropunctata]XP_011701784.1 PREDICTED: cytochrome P450 4C1-like isoform X2 [Wasmannia auropun
MTLISAILVALACIVSYFIWKYICQIFLLGKFNLPGPKKLSDIFPETSNGVLDFIDTLGKHYPSPFQMRRCYMPIVILYEPNQIKTVLRHCLNKGRLYKFAIPLFGMGIASLPESTWPQHRKIIAPSFNSNMGEFFNIFVKHALIFANELEDVGLNGNEIMLFKHTIANAINIACSTLGIEMKTDIRDKCLTNIERYRDIMKHRFYSTWINPFLYFDFIFNFTTLGREQQKIVKSMHSFINKITQQQLQLNKLHEAETNTINKTFLDKLMEIFRKNNFTEKLIRDNIITLIVSASDTIGTTLHFVVFMLANFPEIQVCI